MARPETDDQGEARFRYWFHGEDIDELLERNQPIYEGDEFELSIGWVVAERIDPPGTDGVRLVAARHRHPYPPHD